MLFLITFACIDASAQTISSNSPVCQGKNLQLTSSGGVSYSWSGPNGFTSTLQNPQILNAVLPRSGVYTVAITGANSIVSTATTSVVINPTPIAVTTSNTACEGMSVVLSSVNANPVISSGLSYTWSGSNGFTSTFQNPVLANVSTARSGIYTVTIATAQGCTATATTNVTVNPTPVPPLVTNYTSCAEDAQFTLSATPSAANMQLLWYGNNATGGVSSTTSPTFFPLVAGITTYYVSQRSNLGGCESARSAIMVMVNPKPMPPIVTDKTYTQGEVAASLTATSSTLFWYGMSSSGGIGSVVAPTPNTSTVGTTEYYVSNSDNLTACESNRSKITVTVNPNVVIAAPQISSNKLKLCNGENAILTAAGCAGTITWSNGFTGSSIAINTGGTYNAFCAIGSNQSPNSENIVISTLTTNPPTISSSNGQICLNTTITLTSSVCQDGTITWNNGATGTSIQVSAAGTYSAQCINPCGTSPNSNILTISNAPSAPVISSNKTVLCNGETATLTATGCAGMVQWSNGMTPNSVQLSVAGTYTATCVNACGASSASNSIVLRTNSSPIAVATGSVICRDGVLTLLASNTNPAITGVSYSWAGPSGFVSNLQNPSLLNANTSNAGVYIVTLTSSNGCTATASANVVVNPTPIINVSTNSPICEGENLVMFSTVVDGTTLVYNWTGPNGFTSNQSNVIIANAQSTQTGIYQLSVSSSNACVSSVSVNVVVNPKLVSPLVQNIVACKTTNPIILSATANVGNELIWYGFASTNGVGSTVAPIQDTSVVGTRTYYVSQRNLTTGCESARAALVTQVLPNPSKPQVFNQTMCQGTGPDSLIAIPTDGNTLIWYGMNASGGVGSTSKPFHNPIAAGIFKYYVSQKSITGCESERAELVITVNAKPLAPTGNNITLCEGDAAVTLSAIALPNYTLYWDNYSTTPPTHNPTAAGSFTYNVRQRENLANACLSDLKPIIVLVKPKPVVSISANTPLNVGQTLQFGSTVSAGTSYLWTGPNGFSSTIQNPKIVSVTTNQAGIYTLVGNLNGCSTTATIQVIITAPSIKIFDDALKINWLVNTTATTKNLANTSPVQSGTKSISVKHNKATANIEFVTYNAQSLAGMTHLKFWIHGGTVGSQKIAIKINNITTQYNVVATKNVWTLVNIPLSHFGNPSGLNKIVFMNNATTSQAIYYLDNIYLAGSANARIASSETSTVAIEEVDTAENQELISVEKAEFSIYPNPVVEQHSTLNLGLKGFDEDTILKVELLDNQGNKKKDYMLNINEKQNSIEMPSLDSGIYMIRITDGKKVALKRLIVN